MLLNSLGFCSELCSVVILPCAYWRLLPRQYGDKSSRVPWMSRIFVTGIGSSGSLIPETCLIFLGPKDDPSWVQVALLPFGSETCLEMKFSWDRWMLAGCNLRI